VVIDALLWGLWLVAVWVCVAGFVVWLLIRLVVEVLCVLIVASRIAQAIRRRAAGGRR